jgi:hypothetical protein
MADYRGRRRVALAVNRQIVSAGASGDGQRPSERRVEWQAAKRSMSARLRGEADSLIVSGRCGK